LKRTKKEYFQANNRVAHRFNQIKDQVTKNK
jgi:hypothetical protein